MNLALGFPLPGTGFFAVECSGHLVHCATAAATASSVSSSDSTPRVNSDRSGDPTEMPTGSLSGDGDAAAGAGSRETGTTPGASLTGEDDGAAPDPRRTSRQSLVVGAGSDAARGAAAFGGAAAARTLLAPSNRMASSTLRSEERRVGKECRSRW